jgi:hypothetical protein
MKRSFLPAAFSPSARTVDLSTISGFNAALLLAIVNATARLVIYDPTTPGSGIASVAGSVVTLQFDTTAQGGSDRLFAIYDDGIAGAQEAGGHLASLDTKAPALGQAAKAGSVPVTLASDQGVLAVAGSAAVGTAPTAAPLSVAAVDPSGNKQHLKVASDGGLLVNTGTSYETVAASQTDQVMGSTGATGDLLAGVLVTPATLGPGAVSIKDGSGAAIIIFTGGASSVSNLVPFFIPFGGSSVTGAWKITTGANVSAIGVGRFT